MSTMFGATGAVSNAITKRPALRALRIAGFTPSAVGVIKIPCSLLAIAFSIKAT